ncbi:MAG: ATP-dependent Clp protease ATP-binding subunit [Clostridia bacterium]|nr:ATP-dependent Clp protease ATP-binding subunit [Clostridia bacterium]
MKSKFTQKAQNTLNNALNLAKELGHSYIGSEHLLLGLLAEQDSAAYKLLYARGADADKLKNAAAELGGGEPTALIPSDMTPRTKKIIEASSDISARYSHGYIGTEHLLLAIIEERDCVAVRLLESVGVRTQDVRSDIAAFLESISELPGVSRLPVRKARQKQESATPTLLKYGRDLTAAAAQGKIDPIIGRDAETERVIQIVCRRRKNNPCLIGEPGVGKTAVAEGLAQRISEGNVPDMLEDKRIISLDISSMIAGAKYRGEFEERMRTVMEEIEKNPNVILFIDEIHTIIGAGAAEGAVDASNILKPALARGEIQLIGATTLEEYRKHIEKDAALERRFQPVAVGEPTEDETLDILRGLRDKYEAHHRLKISDEALSAAVSLSVRYVNDRFLPDKAIDLIDEAAAGKRILSNYTPQDIRELENKLHAVVHEKEEAIGNQDFERAATLRDQEKAIRSEYEKRVITYGNARGEETDAVVGYEEIAEAVTRWTGIPVSAITEKEGKRLSELASNLKKVIIGQDAAVDAVAAAIIRGRSGLASPHRPIGSFIFCGNGGVGKTALCRALARELFGTESALLRLDMSEYMEKHSVSRLIGSPPGYVGYGDGGQLTERVRRKPYSVVLFDEIEKAHPEIMNLLLQLLEDGQLTDSQGRLVSFKNAVVIMTSNIGSKSESASAIGFVNDKGSSEDEARVRRALADAFRPEFLDRVDEIIYFPPLSEESLIRICRGMLDELRTRAAAQGIELEFESEAVRHVCTSAKSKGARGLRRQISTLIENPLSALLLEARDNAPAKISVRLNEDGEKLFFDRKS